MKVLAAFISKIFNPLVFAALSVFVAISQSNLSVEKQIFWFFLAVFAVGIPFSLLYFQYKKGRIKDLWSPDAGERALSVLVWLVSSGVFSGLAFVFAAPRLIVALGIVFFVLAAMNAFSANYFKLSVHSEAITVLVFICMLTVSVLFIFLAVLIPLITWARVYLKAHTLSEVTFGTLAAVLAVYFVFNYFGLITF